MVYLKANALLFVDAASFTAKEVRRILKEFREEYPTNEGLAMRSDKSYLNEWAVHALCYRWGIMKDRAKDANLQFDMEPEVKFMYAILGPIARLFLRLYCKK